MPTYIFFRDRAWYPVEIENDVVAKKHIALNPGTLHVVCVEPGHARAVWTADSPMGKAREQQAKLGLHQGNSH